jgi:hypothetical protein
MIFFVLLLVQMKGERYLLVESISDWTFDSNAAPLNFDGTLNIA